MAAAVAQATTVAQVQSVAWELPCAMVTAKKKKKNPLCFLWTRLWLASGGQRVTLGQWLPFSRKVPSPAHQPPRVDGACTVTTPSLSWALDTWVVGEEQGAGR